MAAPRILLHAADDAGVLGDGRQAISMGGYLVVVVIAVLINMGVVGGSASNRYGLMTSTSGLSFVNWSRPLRCRGREIAVESWL